MKIMVVEDEALSLKLANLVLESEGFEVICEQTAEKAIETIKKEPPQAILLDLSLPGMDGLELTRRLKQDPDTQSIVIIAITNYPDLWSKEEALAAGCAAFVIKPINTRVLPQMITDIIAKNS